MKALHATIRSWQQDRSFSIDGLVVAVLSWRRTDQTRVGCNGHVVVVYGEGASRVLMAQVALLSGTGQEQLGHLIVAHCYVVGTGCASLLLLTEAVSCRRVCRGPAPH